MYVRISPVLLVPKVLIDTSQSVEGPVIGLPHTLVCTAIVVVGVSPPLVKIDGVEIHHY